jgi:hypothetical protein
VLKKERCHCERPPHFVRGQAPGAKFIPVVFRGNLDFRYKKPKIASSLRSPGLAWRSRGGARNDKFMLFQHPDKGKRNRPRAGQLQVNSRTSELGSVMESEAGSTIP